jgi:hypothetical protein
MDPPIVD